MENKLTDNEIINCLNDTEGKEDIGIYCTDKNGNFATVVKLTDLVDLLNRQKAEVERLKAMHSEMCIGMKVLKRKAIKEFAERLKKVMVATHKDINGYCRYETEDYYIDTLVKEMEGAEK